MKLPLKFVVTTVCIVTFLAVLTTSAFSEESSSEKDSSYKFAQYFSNKDIDGMASLLNDGVIVYDPGKITEGKENFLKLLKDNFDKTNNISFNILHLYQDSNTTIIEYKLSFDNELYNGVDVIIWKDNKIEEIRCYYNPPGQPTS